MEIVSTYDPVVNTVMSDVKDKQSRGSKKQATLTSPMIQNKILTIIGKEILQLIVDDVVASGKYTICSDECKVHNLQFITFFLGQILTSREESSPIGQGLI